MPRPAARAAAPRPAVEPLEARRLLASTVTLADGVLSIVGDDADGRVDVGMTAFSDTIFVLIDSDQATGRTFNPADVGLIRLIGNGGSDGLYLSPDLDIPAFIDGGEGRDAAIGGRGRDTIMGGTGEDTLQGGGGRDQIFGGDGNDNLSGGSGDDVVVGGPGNDTVNGSAGDDRLFGDGDDAADPVPGDGNDELGGGPGRDTLYGGGGNDNLSGGPGSQDLANYSGRTGPLFIRMGTPGLGRSGGIGEGDSVPADTEKLNGGDGDDRISGNGRDNVIWGGPGDDTLTGNGGDDFLIGFTGDDQLDAGSGDDTLIGGEGDDDLDGSDGTDTADYTDKLDGVRITLDGRANDGTAGRDASPTTGEPATPREADNVRPNIEVVVGTTSDDVIDASAVTATTGVTLYGGPGDDRLVGSPFGNDLIVGGLGRDAMFGNGGDDAIDALDGEVDRVSGGTNGDDGDRAQVDRGDLVTGIELLFPMAEDATA